MARIPLEQSLEIYRKDIEDASAQHGVPANILAGLLAQESRFNPSAKSPVGALGIAQFMPATAREMKIDPLDPKQAIPGAAKYLAQNQKQFNDWDKTIASYNAGPGAVRKADGVPDNPETQKYVPAVKGFAEQFANHFPTPESKETFYFGDGNLKSEPVNQGSDLLNLLSNMVKQYGQ